MSRLPLRQLLLLAACVIFMIPAAVIAGGPAPGAAGCPTGAVCDHALGLALVPPAGWQLIPPDHFPPHTLAWFAGPPLGLDYNVRLLIRSDGTTRDPNDARAAATAAAELIAGSRTPVPATRYPVRYGGAPGILIRGLPGGPGPDAIIILAHARVIYSIFVPGATLAPDQRQALSSLRFIPRAGPFPSSNPPAPFATRGPGDYRKTGGDFAHHALTLTPSNGLRHGSSTYSRWFQGRTGWSLTYSVQCGGGRGRLVIRIEDIQGRVRDLVLHRGGAARSVRQVENFPGLLRLDVQSRCARWSVTAAGVAD